MVATPERGAMATMLPDGSNPEGIEPNPPLMWTRNTFATSKVTLYGVQGSPAVCKVLTYLRYFKIPFEYKDGLGKPGSAYRKVPILDVGDRQVNDSGVITKFLVHAMVGPEAFDEEWEKLITFTVFPSVKLLVVSSPSGFVTWATGSAGLGLSTIRAWVLGSGVARAALKERLTTNPLNRIEPPQQALIKFMAAIPEGQPFFGGDKPCQVDLSMWGIFIPFIAQRVPCMLDLFDECDMWAWAIAMNAAVPIHEINPRATEFDLGLLHDERLVKTSSEDATSSRSREFYCMGVRKRSCPLEPFLWRAPVANSAISTAAVGKEAAPFSGLQTENKLSHLRKRLMLIEIPGCKDSS